MINAFIIMLNEYHPILYLMFMLLGCVLVISIVLSVTLSLLIRIITIKDKDEVFTYFVKKSPKKYHKLLNVKIGGWLMNMEILFFYWRLFSVRYDMKKEEIKEWRNIVKDSFDKRQYVIFRIRTIAKHCFLLIAIPLVMIMSIDMILAN
ncbi:hypothetical protein ACWU37_21465 (plasmid) [Photobacterium damselae subsp. damselae]